MEFSIRPATPEDMPQVLELIKELAVFEREPEAVIVTVQQLIEDGFGPDPAFHCYVATREQQILGMALTYQRYSTWKGKTLHLEDLIVRESLRGHGIGYALFKEVIRHGYNLGVKRIEWAVLDWNTPAIEFYEKQGAQVMRDWDVVQMNETGINTFIENVGL